MNHDKPLKYNRSSEISTTININTNTTPATNIITNTITSINKNNDKNNDKNETKIDVCTPCQYIMNDACQKSDKKCRKGQYNINDDCVYEKELKCAPDKVFKDGSCITTEVLMEMINSFNKQADEKEKIVIVQHYEKFRALNPSKYKRYYLCKLNTKLKHKDQTKWTSLSFINLMNDALKKELLEFTFVPDGPADSHEWLNTKHIVDTLAQYERKYPEFKSLGAVPIDFNELPFLGIKNLDIKGLFKDGKFKIGVVFNLDEHHQSGSHWVSLFANLKKGQIYFCDSVGIEPEPRIRSLMRRFAKFCVRELSIPVDQVEVKVNETPHQQKDSECGVYSLSFILRLLDGETFDDINSKRISDEKIHQCRQVYFK